MKKSNEKNNMTVEAYKKLLKWLRKLNCLYYRDPLSGNRRSIKVKSWDGKSVERKLEKKGFKKYVATAYYGGIYKYPAYKKVVTLV